MNRDQKEQRLQDFVDRFIGRAIAGGPSLGANLRLSLVARSPDSPVAAVLARRLDRLVEAGADIKAIFAVPSPQPPLNVWLAKAASVRWLKDRRLLEAHEQLVLGESASWSGDAMRREPGKIDLFESFSEGCRVRASLGWQAHGRLERLSYVIQPRRITASHSDMRRDTAASPSAQPGAAVPAATEPAAPPLPAPVSTRH
jgi:hypothetical protein